MLIPVQKRVNKSVIIDLRIKRNPLWQHFNLFSLTENMHVYPEQTNFAEYLLKYVYGDSPVHNMGEIELSY